MDILGVGPLEFFFIIIIALIVLGPKDMAKAGRSIGSFLRKLVTSPTWQVVQNTSRDFRNLPNRLIKEAGLDEELEDLNKIKQEVEEIKTGNLTESVDEINKEISEVNKDLKKTQKELEESQKDLSDWTIPPKVDSPQPAAVPSAEDSGEEMEVKLETKQTSNPKTQVGKSQEESPEEG